MADYVIELNSVGGPCWVATGGGDPERTHLIECAEIYATEHEARESAAAFRSKYPNRKFFVRVKPLPNPDEAANPGAYHRIFPGTQQGELK